MSLDYLQDEGISSARVLAAMRKVPRERFVPEDCRWQAYENRPLSIGHGQTISQPYVVAYMTEMLDVRPRDKVLEIGTGSGYQCAILAELSDEVYTVEIIPVLAERARALLNELGYERVHTRIGDGNDGWPEYAPYDAIMVTAAPPSIPPVLVAQLAGGGRMIVPVGPIGGLQELVLVTRSRTASVSTQRLLAVRFVPLTGGR